MSAIRYASARENVRPLSHLFKALGDETRLRMVALLDHGALCVCHLESALGLSQWAASRHLAVLRAAGVVDSERRGTWVHYRLVAQEDGDRRQVLRSLLSRVRRRQTFGRDAERLLQRRGPGTCK